MARQLWIWMAVAVACDCGRMLGPSLARAEQAALAASQTRSASFADFDERAGPGNG